jgi:hypothetical protein
MGKIYNKFGSLKPVTDLKVSFKMNRKNITKTVIHLIIVATRFALVTTGYTLVTPTLHPSYIFLAKHSNLVAHHSGTL